MPNPTNVAMKTPPRDRRVMPSESSSTGHRLLRVLFQYFPKKIGLLSHSIEKYVENTWEYKIQEYNLIFRNEREIPESVSK